MTDKEKLEKIEKLADAMYNAAMYLTTDASRLHKAMDEYHNFIIHECKEEPVSEELEEAAKKEAEIVNALGGEFPPNPLDMELIKTIFIHGAEWQKEKEYTCYEEAFEDGASWKKEQMMAKAIDAELLEGHLIRQKEVTHPLHAGDKVKLIIIKEDEL